MAKKRVASSKVETDKLLNELRFVGAKRAFALITKNGRLTALRKKQLFAVWADRDLLLELGKLQLLANLSKKEMPLVLGMKIGFADLDEEEVLKILLAKIAGKESRGKIDQLTHRLIRKHLPRTAKRVRSRPKS
ncbi:MAG: hypothetical protein AAB354_07850 [candidate division KSB1 bacterium]